MLADPDHSRVVLPGIPEYQVNFARQQHKPRERREEQ
jgi:hypothetical protein